MRKIFLSFVLLAVMAASVPAEGSLREKLRARLQQHKAGMQTMKMAGLNVAYWLPDDAGSPAPLILFSHGLNGCKGQSTFLMTALAKDGYVVVAPDHKDALCANSGKGGGLAAHKPEAGFANFAAWTDQTNKDREEDMKNLYSALKSDPDWSPRIDWNRVGLAGHSMGGYTVMGLAGAWPSWKMDGIKAVLALSPYGQPFLKSGDLAHVDVPIMYQGGTRDIGDTPFIKKKGGLYDITPSPAWFVEFRDCGHFSFTDIQQGAHRQMIDYSLWFFDHTLKGSDAPLPKEDGVTDLRQK